MTKEEEKEPEEYSEKIVFGDKSDSCFACGTKLDPFTKKCRYCNTKQI